jgi:2,4-dienoyl-CoA reductase-like NADH-dependent reductase (Old Yellow Enzyme family)
MPRHRIDLNSDRQKYRPTVEVRGVERRSCRLRSELTDFNSSGGTIAPMPALGDPIDVGPVRLRNRFVATAHASGLVQDGLAMPGDAEYWGRVAEGGAAMLISGGTVTAPESTPRRRNLVEAWRPEVVPGLARRVDAIHAGASVAVCQLVHLGRETLGAETWYAPVGPSAVRSPREPTAPRPLTDAEIDDVIEGHRAATENAVDAGFDGVELHAAHGYLVSQFLAATTNVRPGAHELEGRVDFLRRLLEVMREAAPGRLLGVRLSVGGAHEAGLDLDALCAVLPLVGGLVDYVNLTVGVRTTYVRDMATERPPLLDDLPRLRSRVGVPLIASQSFRDPRDMEEALARGADLVGMARPFIADPELPSKLLAGRWPEVRPCVSCNEDCRAFDPCLLCSVNPDLAPPGQRQRPAVPLAIATSGGAGERVAVVGAGPAGLECAMRLAAGGRAVTLWDARDRIGGQLAVAAAAPHRRGWMRLLDFYASALERLGVDARLGRAAGGEELEPYDEIVLAVGSDEVLPDVEGIAAAVRSSDAITAGPEALAGVERLVIVDDGYGWWPCVSTVELAAAAGVAETTVVTPSTAFAAGIPAESRVQFFERIGASCPRIVPLARLAAVEEAGVQLRGAALSHLLADAVIVVGERRPRSWSWLGERAGVRAVGDCIVPRRVQHAVSEGRAAADQILHAAEPVLHRTH